MKCPVCQKELSGQQCLNCGYEMKDSDLKKSLNKKVKSPSIAGKKLLGIIGILIVIMMLSLRLFMHINIVQNSTTINMNKYKNLTFDVVLEKNYDEDDTVNNINQLKKEIIEYLNDNHYIISTTIEECNKYSKDDSLNAYLHIKFLKENKEYNLSTEYKKGKMIKNHFDITFTKDNQRNRYNAPKEIDVFLNYLNIKNDVFKESYAFMSKTNNKTFVYESSGEYDIKMIETLKDKQYICYYELDSKEE